MKGPAVTTWIRLGGGVSWYVVEWEDGMEMKTMNRKRLILSRRDENMLHLDSSRIIQNLYGVRVSCGVEAHAMPPGCSAVQCCTRYGGV